MTTLPEYWDMLKAHDWYYQMSDDFRVWHRGDRNYSRLKTIAEESPEHHDLLMAFGSYYFNGTPMGNNNLKLPERPDE